MATEKEKLEKKISEKIKQEAVALNYLRTVQEERYELENQLKSLMPVHISEHALLRYFERIYKVPVQEIRNELYQLLADVPLAVKKSKDIRYCHKGLNLHLKNGTVVTILESEEGK